MLLGDYEDAVTTLLKATRKHKRAELYYQLSNCYYHLREDEKGREALRKALELDPGLAEDMQQKYPYIKDEMKKVKSKKK